MTVVIRAGPVRRIQRHPSAAYDEGTWPFTAYGLNPEGGSTGARHRTRESESDLHR